MQLDPYACGHFRCRYPLLTLRERGHHTEIHLAGHPKWRLSEVGDLTRFTHILCQRQVDLEVLERLLEVKKQTGVCLIYECDDNLHKVHPESHAFRVFTPNGEVVRAVEKWIRASDGLIVTTPDLAGEYSRLNNQVFVINNYLDLHIRDWHTPVPRHEKLNGKTVIGWAGGSTHAEDEEPLRGVLAQILKEYDDVMLCLCSHPKMMASFVLRQGLPKERVLCLDPVHFDIYPTVPAQFDIGLAPLRDTQFNRNKSALKIMEYGARGVPYVASDIAPYRRFHKETNGVGGFLAETKSDWDTALRHLIEQGLGRVQKGLWFQEHIQEHWGLQTNIGKWEEVLTKAREPHAVNIWERTEKPGRNDACPCGSGVKYKRCCSPAFG